MPTCSGNVSSEEPPLRTFFSELQIVSTRESRKIKFRRQAFLNSLLRCIHTHKPNAFCTLPTETEKITNSLPGLYLLK